MKPLQYNKSLTSPLPSILSPFDSPPCHRLSRVIRGNNCCNFDVYNSRLFSTFIYVCARTTGKLHIIDMILRTAPFRQQYIVGIFFHVNTHTATLLSLAAILHHMVWVGQSLFLSLLVGNWLISSVPLLQTILT